jgi:hypothetical protein
MVMLQGWSNTVIPFKFAGAPVIDTVTIQLDNTWVGGVYSPAAILIDGLSLVFTPPAIGSVGSVSFTGLGLLGKQPHHRVRPGVRWLDLRQRNQL